MASDKFFIAPIAENINYASSWYNRLFTRRCIMSKDYRIDIINEIGNIYHDLTVISYAGKGTCRGAYWICRCVCSKEVKISGGHLRSSKRKSCGCRSERFIDQTGVNRLYSGYKRKSKIRNIAFNLTREYFEILVKGDCTYCGTAPSQILKRNKSRKLQILYSGIDRIDSDKDYTKENCVSCCRYCNQSKSDLSIDQWKEYIRRVYAWLLISST